MVKYMQSSKQRRDFIDVTKFALSILIVVIHISPIESLNPVLRPFLRTAVPLFFLISAYLFFKKYGEAETIEKKIARIERYVKRNLQLYFFWLIVLLIPTLSYRQWFSDGLLSGLFWALHSFLFGSTFIASWYIMASIIATLIIVVASRYLGNKTILLLSAIPYLACCAMSNYGASPLVAPHYDTLCYAFGSNDYNSFWVAIFWIAAGKCIADNELRLSKVNTSSLLAIIACRARRYLYRAILHSCKPMVLCRRLLPWTCHLLHPGFHIVSEGQRQLQICGILTKCEHCHVLPS